MQTPSRSSSSPRGYDARGRQADADARRQRVIDSARRLFLERGSPATSIADVAEAATVSPQMIYASFGGKAGILARVVDVAAGGDDENVLLRERAASVAARAIDDPRERLRAMARQSAELNERVGPVLALVDSASSADESVGELRERITSAMREDCPRRGPGFAARPTARPHDRGGRRRPAYHRRSPHLAVARRRGWMESGRATPHGSRTRSPGSYSTDRTDRGTVEQRRVARQSAVR